MNCANRPRVTMPITMLSTTPSQSPRRACNGRRLAFLGMLGLLAVACEEDPVSAGCPNATAISIQGKDTGLIECGNGLKHRTAKMDCADLRTSAPKTLPADCDCLMDSQCNDSALGVCGPSGTTGTACGCWYGCTTDADCGGGEICLCGDPVGQCVPATCATDADCDGGLCSVRETSGSTTYWYAAECETDDECDAEGAFGCPAGQVCTSNETSGRKECSEPNG